ncbi:hypothetical protein [Acidiphilium iwatense]|uniref:Uncharacterized protein n=1 Tax=Acidiphilium iwatense TaxID=768198 RepID=A0ABS9DW76_9PROT|nr:hypothetical protein [Acidiphilium iwatense]MCF3945584.1 hypothetical protein [Acidiphilium iwatense]
MDYPTTLSGKIEGASPRSIDAVLRRMIADREALVAARDAELAARDHAIAALERDIATRDQDIAARNDAISMRDHAIAALERDIAALRPQAERLTRLALALEWRDGPRALLAVLPAARLLRRLTRR